MKWTKEKPKDHFGMFWYKDEYGMIDIVEKINDNIRFGGGDYGDYGGNINQLNGHWSDKPIPEPEGEI